MSAEPEEIRADVESARAVTERYRVKADELVEELWDRDAAQRDAAAGARLAAEQAREEADRAIEIATGAERRTLERARKAIRDAEAKTDRP